jgi:hypothetical protein
MANKKASDLSTLSISEIQTDDLFILLDVNSNGTGKEELKNITVGDFFSYFGSGSYLELLTLSQSIVAIGASITSAGARYTVDSSSFNAKINLLSGSLAGKLSASLTGSYQSFGLPVLGPDSKIYSDFLPASSTGVSSIFGRNGDVVAAEADYSDFYLKFSGGSLTGPLFLYGMPVDNFESSPKIYVDNQISMVSSSIEANSGSIVNLGTSIINLSSSIAFDINQLTSSIEELSSSVESRQSIIETILSGGDVGNILVKNSDLDYDFSWVSSPFGSFAYYPILNNDGEIEINQGFVNNIEAEGTGLSSDSWTTGSLNLYWVKVEVDPIIEQAISASVETGSVLPTNTSTFGYQALFLLQPNGDIASQHVKSSLRHVYSGSIHYFTSL